MRGSCQLKLIFIEQIVSYGRFRAGQVSDGAESRKRCTCEPLSEEVAIHTETHSNVFDQFDSEVSDKDLMLTILFC